jgi:hypothetical protein
MRIAFFVSATRTPIAAMLLPCREDVRSCVATARSLGFGIPWKRLARARSEKT